MDPFHDNPLQHLTGYPDVVTAPSIVRQVKATSTISAPADLGDNTWQASIVCWPWTGTPTFNAYSCTGNAIVLPGGAAADAQQVAVYTAAQTAGAFNYSGGAYNDAASLSLNPAMQTGKGRLVGMGYEIQNTTAPLYRGGSLVAYRIPGAQDKDDVIQVYTGGFVDLARVLQVNRVTTPPQTAGQAMLVPGSRTWPAEQGVYQVVPFKGDNQPEYPTTTYPLFQPITYPPLQVSQAPPTRTVITGNAVSTDPYIRMLPTDIVGSIFSGLTPQTTLQLSVVWYFEEFPDINSDVLTLAKPSCEYDPVALAMYTEVLNTLPVAVPSSWNAAGDWFWDVVGAIKEHAVSVGAMIGGTPGAAIGGAASTLAGFVQDRYMTAPGQGGSGAPKPGPARKAKQQPKPKAKQPQAKPKAKPSQKQKQQAQTQLTRQQKREVGQALAAIIAK